MVEFALIISLLLVLSLGLVQYGILMNKAIALSHVSREGGRYAAVRATQPDIDKDIKKYMIDVGRQNGLTIAATDITVSPAQNTAAKPTNRTQYAPLTITLTYNMGRHLFLPATFLRQNIRRHSHRNNTNGDPITLFQNVFSRQPAGVLQRDFSRCEQIMKTNFNNFPFNKTRAAAARRSGIAFIYVALGLTVFLGVAAIVVDVGYAYTRRGEAQKAADSGSSGRRRRTRVW